MKSLGKFTFLCVCLVVGQLVPVCGQVMISEFLAINVGGLQDEDGESSDWIELYNTGSSTVNTPACAAGTCFSPVIHSHTVTTLAAIE